jgi:RNA-binding protein
MITAKQRSYLKSLANKLKPYEQIGKDGITEAFLAQLEITLEKHELVKVNVLDSSMLSAKEAANDICEKVRAEFVQAIGNKFVIYKRNHDEPKIELPRK